MSGIAVLDVDALVLDIDVAMIDAAVPDSMLDIDIAMTGVVMLDGDIARTVAAVALDTVLDAVLDAVFEPIDIGKFLFYKFFVLYAIINKYYN